MNYKKPKMQHQLDGGYSGPLTVTAAAGKDRSTLVFVDSELLGNLVLTPAEAALLGKVRMGKLQPDRAVSVPNRQAGEVPDFRCRYNPLSGDGRPILQACDEGISVGFVSSATRRSSTSKPLRCRNQLNRDPLRSAHEDAARSHCRTGGHICVTASNPVSPTGKDAV